jgi:mannose-1-phosphate guanylyltransferase/mannose-6-phosphate isomerase
LLFGARSTFQDTLMRVSDPFRPSDRHHQGRLSFHGKGDGIEADVLPERMRHDSGPAIAASDAFARRAIPTP